MPYTKYETKNASASESLNLWDPYQIFLVLNYLSVARVHKHLSQWTN